MEKRNKNLVTTSIISVALCGALLVGSSFAWFTDKVESTGNTIKSGELEITATNDSGNVLDANNPMFVAVDKAEPGWSDYATVNVENTGTLAADVKATFTVKGELAPAMWYSFDDGLTKTAMTNGGTFEVQEQQILENAKADIEITYGMYTTAGNDYQNKTLTMDLSIDAKQSTYEEDGFGSDQYDVDAKYEDEIEVEVNNYNDFKAQLDAGKKNIKITDVAGVLTVDMNEAITIPEGTTVKFSATGTGVMVNVNANIVNNGTINVGPIQTVFQVTTGTTLTNNGTINVNGTVQNYGTVIDNGTIVMGTGNWSGNPAQ